MEKEMEEALCATLISVVACIVGFILGCVYMDYSVNTSGIKETSYCKEIQVDTLQYNYQQDMYKFEIKLIK